MYIFLNKEDRKRDLINILSQMQNTWVYVEMQTQTTFVFNVYLFLFQEAMSF